MKTIRHFFLSLALFSSFLCAATEANPSLKLGQHSLYHVFDELLQIEDGSYWEVSDLALLKTWKRGDLLTITPDYSWQTSYDYFITNQTTNSYLKADFHGGSLPFGPLSNWIVDIDYSSHIYLQNGVIWCVHPKDRHLINHFAINDHVILGLEHSIGSSHDHILIHVNTEQFIRVKQY